MPLASSIAASAPASVSMDAGSSAGAAFRLLARPSDAMALAGRRGDPPAVSGGWAAGVLLRIIAARGSSKPAPASLSSLDFFKLLLLLLAALLLLDGAGGRGARDTEALGARCGAAVRERNAGACSVGRFIGCQARLCALPNSL